MPRRGDADRDRRALYGSFAGWPAILGAAALLVAGCGERSPRTPTACEPSRASAPDRPRGLDPAPAKRLQGTPDRVRREQKIPGVAAAVMIGDCLWVGASGFADLRTREPVRADTPFEVGSITKTFVAALVLKLAEDGMLALDDRLSRWVPELPGSRRITLRQLLNHTAGRPIRDGRAIPCGAAPPRPRRDVDTAAIAALRARAGSALELLQHQRPPARPGHRTSHPFDPRT
jgi:CubicO group peptidase (beta-lactamase class C family)